MPSLEPISPEQLAEACQAVPLFPLPSVVLLPHTVMPLHVFEDRYRALVKDVLEAPLPLISVPLLAPGWEQSYGGTPAVHTTAGLGRVVHHEQLSDGRYNIALLGIGRIHIEEELQQDHLYRTARAVIRPDQLPPGGLGRYLLQLRMLLSQLLVIFPRLQADLGHFLENPEPSPALIDALAHLVFPDPQQRQKYIEHDRLSARADMVIEGLADILARSSQDIPEA